MHDPGAFLGRHEVRGPHPIGCAGRFRPRREVVEGRLVAEPLELAPLDGPLHRPRPVAAEHRLDGGRGEDEGLAALPHPRVVHFRVHREGEVGGEGPGGGGPDEERDLAAVLPTVLTAVPVAARPGAVGRLDDDGETHVYGRVLDLLVAERNLVGRQGRPDPGVVGDHLVPAVEEPLVPDGLQEMPDRLDVGVVEGVVGVAHVHPEAHSLGHALPVADVAHDRLAAARVNSSIPTSRSMRDLSKIPSSFSISCSTGRPWVSQPARRGSGSRAWSCSGGTCP